MLQKCERSFLDVVSSDNPLSHCHLNLHPGALENEKKKNKNGGGLFTSFLSGPFVRLDYPQKVKKNKKK